MATESKLRIPIPAEHVCWFRKLVKEEMGADGSEACTLADDITRDKTIEINEKVARYIALLDHIGWETDCADPGTAHIEASLAEYLVDKGLGCLGEDLQIAAGGYSDQPLSRSDVKVVAARAIWLAGVGDLISPAEEV